MHYGEIKNCDIANGLGVRVTLFVSGCTNHCENCFQPQTWDFCYGKPFTSETEDELIRLLSPDYINGLTLLGGEPFEPKNQRALLPFLRRVRRELPQKTIWSFTGFALPSCFQADCRFIHIFVYDGIILFCSCISGVIDDSCNTGFVPYGSLLRIGDLAVGQLVRNCLQGSSVQIRIENLSDNFRFFS